MLEDQVRWDERYRTANHCDRGRAAQPLLDALDWLATVRPPQPDAPRALDLACGLGRNARAMASAGYDVTAVDISSEALTRAQALAQEAGLRIHWQQADLDHYSLQTEAFELITCSLFLDRTLFEAIPRALKPGGVVWYEALLMEEREGVLVGNLAHRTRPNELLEAFQRQGLRILRWEEGLPGQLQPNHALVATLLGMRPFSQET